MEEEKESVRVLTRDEKNSYEGVTIDADGNEADSRHDYQQDREQPQYYRVYSSHAPFSQGLGWSRIILGNDWRTRIVRIAALIGVATVVVLFVSFVLPVLLGAVGLAIAYYFIKRLLIR
ncbi:hypothetical protein [Selenomonas sp. KH1T6]|uniref:hypothetical protein n=1 Tax=Selenomonas sp. KH1T6 TaxID=3158784 RepID=UPI0008A764C6|nr:hypothetical protein SAMN05216583_10788 [Selenomonas ruminantium]